MWYEILPSFVIMTTCLFIPGLATAQFHKYIYGSKERRSVRVPWQWSMTARDIRLSDSGKYFESKGLENIH